MIRAARIVSDLPDNHSIVNWIIPQKDIPERPLVEGIAINFCGWKTSYIHQQILKKYGEERAEFDQDSIEKLVQEQNDDFDGPSDDEDTQKRFESTSSMHRKATRVNNPFISILVRFPICKKK